MAFAPRSFKLTERLVGKMMDLATCNEMKPRMKKGGEKFTNDPFTRVVLVCCPCVYTVDKQLLIVTAEQGALRRKFYFAKDHLSR